MSKVLCVIKTNEGGMWILPHVRAMRSRGHDVTVLLPAGDGRLRRALDSEGVSVLESAFDFSYRHTLSTVRGLWRTRRQVATVKADVVFYHLYASALAVRLATLGMRVRRVHMVAGPLYLDSRPIRALERVLARLDDVVIAGSEHTAERYRALGMPSHRVESIPYGIDAAGFAPASPDEAAAARERLGVAPGTVLFVMVAFVYAPKGGLHGGAGIKGHHTLIDAWRQFAVSAPNAELIVVGSGFDAAGEAHRQELLPAFENLPNARWFESVEDVRAFYAAADVSLAPSLSENHGSALEATLSGVPCVVSDAGALPETVDPATGWIFEAGDADALNEAMQAAYAQGRTGLARRGRLARERNARIFDSRALAEKVADVVTPQVANETSAVADYALFVEARVTEDSKVPEADLKVFPAHGTRRVHARAAPGAGGGSGDPTVSFSPLPYYVGLRQTLTSLPRLVAAVRSSVRLSRVVLAKQPGVIGLLAVLFAKRQSKPVAVSVVGDIADVLRSGAGGKGGRVLAPLAASLTRWAVRRADIVHYVTRQTLQQAYPARADTPTFAFSNVVVTSIEPIERRSHRNTLIVVGSQETGYKGHDVAIRALSTILSVVPDVRLHVVGDGRTAETLHRLAEDLDLQAHVHFHGHVATRAEIDHLLKQSDVFLMPSRTEGLPRALIEAMAQGLPAIGTDVGGIPELVHPAMLVEVNSPSALARRVLDLQHDDIWDRMQKHSIHVATTYLSSEQEVARELFRMATSRLSSQ